MSTASPTAESPVARRRDGIPPLENGDRLTRAEFERRYEAMPDLRKAELIEGVVYMPSPVRLRRHGEPHSLVIGWLATYKARTPGLILGDNVTVRLDLDNEPQPDALLLVDPARGGQAGISDDDYVEGAPELIAEIAASSASYDLNAKLHVYRRNGVREYVVWQVLEEKLCWFVLRQGQYEEQPLDGGLLRSEVFPGLWLDPEAMARRGDLATVLDTLQKGIATPEHAAFVERLGSSRSG
jgi:Uma2 family endonuclease